MKYMNNVNNTKEALDAFKNFGMLLKFFAGYLKGAIETNLLLHLKKIFFFLGAKVIQ